jgi:hypothetical protein
MKTFFKVEWKDSFTDETCKEFYTSRSEAVGLLKILVQDHFLINRIDSPTLTEYQAPITTNGWLKLWEKKNER